MRLPDRLHGLRYRAVSRIMHKYNFHHTSKNLMDDGTILHWCHWCGMRHREVPMWMTIQSMEKALQEKRDYQLP
jgi:hypothetical protein